MRYHESMWESKFESIGEDLMEEIFVKVGKNLKSVIRLRCVSKSWRRLVNSRCLPRLTCNLPPKFKGHLMKVEFGSRVRYEISASVLAYTAHHCQRDSDHFGQQEEGRRLVEKIEEDRGLVFLDAYNGLLLHRLNNTNNNPASPPPVYHVSNLETNSCVVVNGEADTTDSVINKLDHAALAYDLRESFLSFKIVAFFKRLTPSSNFLRHKCMRIYSSKTGKWSPDVNFDDHHLLRSPDVNFELNNFKVNWLQQSIYLNGALYRYSILLYLMRFEVRDDEENYDECCVQAIRIPKARECFLFEPMLVGINKGQITLVWPVNIYKDLTVRVLQEEGNGSNYSYQWILKHKISIYWGAGRLLSGCDPLITKVRGLGFHPYEDALVLYLVDGLRFHFFCWHFDGNNISLSANHHAIRDTFQLLPQVGDRPYSFPLLSCVVPLQ